MTKLNLLSDAYSFITIVKTRLFRLSSVFFTTFIIVLFFFVQKNTMAQQPSNHPDLHKISVDSVIQTSNYTYVKATTDLNTKAWYALPKKDIQIKENYYYYNAVEMKDFKSTELKRIFASVLFINDLINPEEFSPETSQKQKTEVVKKHVISPSENGITIAELFTNRAKYNNKIIKVKGEVSKYNDGIMKRNWIHLTDNSPDSKGYDFTATTQMVVAVGEIITLEGKIVLNKDFGSGYFYEVLMEDGKVIR